MIRPIRFQEHKRGNKTIKEAGPLQKRFLSPSDVSVPERNSKNCALITLNVSCA